MKTLAIIIAIFFYVNTISAQANTKSALTDDEITQLSSNLTMKLLLSDAQESAVSDLLKTYRAELNKMLTSSTDSAQDSQSKLITSTNNQIIALLDSKQKMKFNVISSDWWKSVQEAESN